MRRLCIAAAIIAALVLPTVGAQAHTTRVHRDTHYAPWWPKTTCKLVGSGQKLCLDVYADKRAAGGLILQHVYERIEGGPWETNAFGGDYLVARNDNGNIVWRKDNHAVDIDKSPGYTLFGPHLDMPNSNRVKVYLAGYPHLNAEKDPGWTQISVEISY